MRLQKLLNEIPHAIINGIMDQEIQGLACDSRQVGPGFVFVALKGHTEDGHAYIQDAVQRGVVAVVSDSFAEAGYGREDLTLVKVPDPHKALPGIAANYFDHPHERLNLIGITGTNGKTTTSYLLESILYANGASPGVIGTINYRSPRKRWPAATTTPGPLELMQVFRKMLDDGVTDVVMEVSSHALDQGRVDGCAFRTAVFTNLSRDHLDYHGSMAEYFKAKSLLFQGLVDHGANGRTRAVINVDDPKGRDLINLTRVPVMTYGLHRDCNVRAEEIRSTRKGLAAKLLSPTGEMDIHSGLIGDYNIYNILAAAAAALCLNIEPAAIVSGIKALGGVPGRLERVYNKRELTIVVDYAHTPDALLKALKAITSLAQGGRVITVFGCGGDRDKGKRREMGLISGEHSDWVVVTSDNPRTEDPLSIIAQIEEGIIQAGLQKYKALPADRSRGPGYVVDPDRGSAIRKAVDAADPRDLILIAGKGHEDYQIIGKDKRHFDDREAVAAAAG